MLQIVLVINIDTQIQHIQHGMAYMEEFDIKNAINRFIAGLSQEQDVELYVFLSICHMFLSDARSKQYLKKAYSLNKKKTVEMLSQFFTSFIKDHPEIGTETKRLMKNRLKELEP